MSINAYDNLKVKDLAKVLKLLGEPNRLHILCSMGLECCPVNQIVSNTGLTQTNVSFHLRALREANLVKANKQGSQVYYCLYNTDLLEWLQSLQHIMLKLEQEK